MFEQTNVIQETVHGHIHLILLMPMTHERVFHRGSFDLFFENGTFFNPKPDCIMCKLGALPCSSGTL